MRRLALWLAAAMLGGCAQLPPVAQPPAPGAVTVNEQASHRYIEIVGPRSQHAPPFLGVPNTNYLVLRSWLDRSTGEAHHQLYVSDSYVGPERRWQAATAPDGTALPFVAISHDKIACTPECSWTEDFAADIPDALLRANPAGLTVAFAGASGATMRIAVSGVQVRAQLAAVAAERRLVTSRDSRDRARRSSVSAAPPRYTPARAAG